MIIFKVALMCFVLTDVYGRNRTWICNTNADDRQNWIGGDFAKNCRGFHFPEQLGDVCLMSLKKLTTDAIYFPVQGDVELRENTEIIFSEKSDTCVKIRGDIKLRNLADPQCWQNDNEAVPDTERVPCASDKIILPPDMTFNIEQSPFSINAQIVSMKGQLSTSLSDFWSNFRTNYGCSEFVVYRWFRLYTEHFVPFPEMKFCRLDADREWICNLRTDWRRIVCSDPVDVVGHCTGFCGSVMHVLAKEAFDINKFFKSFIKDQDVDAYYSLIDDNPNKYQITMTDRKTFTGDSISYAKKFYENIKEDLNTWNIIQIRANFSGYPIDNEKTFEHAMGILFGTFFAVVVMFAFLFLFYVGPLRDTNIKIPNIPKLSKSKKSAKTRKQFLFARFENKDDGTMSIGGSTVSLDKAFDNPMYGQQMASTSSGSIMETVEEGEEIKEIPPNQKSESTFSNPVYSKETTMDLAEE